MSFEPLPLSEKPYTLLPLLTPPPKILGMVQNMSVFTCPNCNHSTHIFGSEGVPRECNKHGIDFLGDVPLHASICGDADRGRPTVVAEPRSSRAKAFRDIAEQLSSKLGITRYSDTGQ
jgi:ATP-binding protein involved in chromosome partitioning